MRREATASSRKGERKMAMRTETAIERVFDRCNLIGEDVDIYEIMMQYKVLREKSTEEQEDIYFEIADRLGFLKWM